MKTLQKKAPEALYNTVFDEESATKHDTSDGIIIMSGTAYGGGTIIPGQRKEDEKAVQTIWDVNTSHNVPQQTDSNPL